MATETIRLECTTPGTDAWLKSSIKFAGDVIRLIDRDATHFFRKSQELIKHKAWELYFKDDPKTWERFLKEALGVRDVEDTLEVLRGVEYALELGVTGEIPATLARKQLGKHGRPTKEEQENKGANRHVISRGENHAEYLTARIGRDRPDILERLDNREFKSVREAAIEAGIVKPTKKISFDAKDPSKAATTILNAVKSGKVSIEYVQQLVTILVRRISDKE